MKSGAKGTDPPGTDRGAGLAAPVPLDNLATEQSQPDKFQAVARTMLSSTAAVELTQWHFPSLGSEATEDDGTADILDTFRRWLMGLRHLPRRERAQALRAAREWLSLALTALREKRAHERYARYMLRRLRQLPPRQPG
jgi:hypothetical protein